MIFSSFLPFFLPFFSLPSLVPGNAPLTTPTLASLEIRPIMALVDAALGQHPDSQHTPQPGAQPFVFSPTCSPAAQDTSLTDSAPQVGVPPEYPTVPHHQTLPSDQYAYGFERGHTPYHISPHVSTGISSADQEHAPPSASTHHPGSISAFSGAHHSPDSSMGQSGNVASRNDAFAVLPTPPSTTGTIDTQPFVIPTSVFAVLPPHIPPTCPLDEILVDFIASRREMISNGGVPETVVGLRKPTVKALMTVDAAPSVPPLSRIISRVLSTFTHTHQTEKMGFFYLMCHTTMVGCLLFRTTIWTVISS